jgi:type I restriction enzyme S subunit
MNEWKKVILKDVIESACTGLDAIKRAPIVANDTGIKCLRIQDISQSKQYKEWGFTNVDQKNYEKFRLQKDDIIIARTGNTIGVNRFFNKDLASVFNNGLIRLRVKKDLADPKYIFYNLRSKYFKDFIDSISGGTSTQPNMQIGVLLTLDILLPKLDEQKKIAEVICSIDDKIQLLTDNNNTLEQLAEVIYKEWFENIVNDVSSKFMNIEDVAIVQNGYSFKSSEFIPEQDDTIEVLKMGHISANGGLRSSPKKDFVKRSEKYNNWILNRRDIILAMTDMKDNVVILGVPALIDKDNKYVLNQRVGRIYIKKNSPIVNILILFMQMKEKNFVSELQSKSNSGVQVNLGTDAIRQSRVSVPSKEKQMLILPKLESIFDKLENNRNQVQQLETLRDNILPKMISGLLKIVN